jgi:hypothetical protein
MTNVRESHERALGSSLLVIESNLQRIKASLSEGNSAEQTVTHRTRDNLDSEAKPRILEVIEDMLDEIKQMKETFELETEERSLKAEIAAALTEIWIILVDLEPDNLDAYGELSESDTALIEPNALSLMNKLDKFNKLLYS